jgi:mRNA-degrading endonuclease RelE of RelBE toxin-antitoxin system
MTKIFSDVRRLAEFDKEFKRLQKKLRTLDEDLDNFIKTQLQAFHKLGQDNRGCFRISDLGIAYPHIYKAKKFTCKSLKGRGVSSGIRVIYAYYPQEDAVEFIEIYYKGDKENEDRDRILHKYHR